MFDGAVPATGTVTAQGETGSPLSATCGVSGPCEGVLFPDFTPGTVTITVQLSGGTVSQTFTPSYADFYPNGRDCDPRCRIGDIEMTI